MANRVKNDERGLLFKAGNYLKVLKPGKYSFFPFLNYKIRIMNLNQPFEVADKNLNLFLDDQELLKELDVIDVKDGEIALHYEDGLFSDICLPGKYAFWNVLKTHSFIRINRKNPEVADDIDTSLFSNSKLVGFFYLYEVESHEQGVLFFNGAFQRILKAGKYYFWNGPVTVNLKKVDLRQQQLDMTGQEIMTEDKVTLRLNFVCHYKIINPEKIVLEIKDYEAQLYILLQLILREYVGSLKLDELLKVKQEIGKFILTRLEEKSEQFGIKFIFAGVKDIILPGEIKDILNLVLKAEKKAQATIITRREETASTRSLLNTARLMENNQILFRLKELEYLERISEKIGNISLMGGGSLLESLNALVQAGIDKKKEK